MVKRCLSVALICIGFSGSVVGVASPQDHVMVYGAGVVSCGRWLEESRRGEIVIRGLTLWVQGFVSGVAAAEAPNGGEFKTTDVAGMQAFIDQWCAEHPIKSLQNASVALAVTLRIE